MPKQPVSSHKPIDISSDSIQISQNRARQDSKTLLQENKFIKKQNDVLKKELESLSIRLDGQIQRRLESEKKKYSIKSEDVSQMELQNAYKKCQIYKKEASLYRKKIETMGSETKIEELERKTNELLKENQKLKDEMKQIKKISKLQEKGLTEMGADGYSKMVADNQKLQDEVRRLKKQLDEQRRGKERSALNSNRTQTEKFMGSKVEADITQKDVKFEESIKKRIKTQQQEAGNSEDLAQVLHQKVEKDYQKIRALVAEKNKLRDMVDNLKGQLADKDKENANLKDKMATLRKNNQLLLDQLNTRNPSRREAELQDSKINKENREREPREEKDTSLPTNSRLEKLEVVQPKNRIWKRNEEGERQSDPISEASEGSEVEDEQKYPRKEERGSKMKNTLKWSHQNFSSKIKQIQLLIHESSGHIKNIHARYEKGEPKKYEQSGKTKYHILSCSEGEYVKHVEGCFSEGYLQYLAITTSSRRVERYGNWQEFQNNEECEHFEFEVRDNQYPGALFGESDPNGVRRLGCFIHKET